MTSTEAEIMPVVGPPMGPPPTMGGYPPQFAPHPGGPPPPMGNEQQPTQAMMVESAHKRKDSDDFLHRNFTMKEGFWHYLTRPQS